MNKRPLFPACAALLLVLPFLAVAAKAQAKSPLSASSARNLIRRMAGIELPSSAVRVERVSSPDGKVVDALAEIETAFRLVQEQGRWRVAEIRTGDNRWEEIDLISRALEAETPPGSRCAEASATEARTEDTDPGVRLVRCLLAELAVIALPSNAVRVKSISPLSLPFGNAPSALVEARVGVNFRLQKGADGKWRVTEIGTGSNRRADVESLVSRLNELKKARALEDLHAMATALEAFRRERGFYVEAKAESVLVDQLNPRYLKRVIRIDPWRKPYQYEGTRDAYTLRSDGADGKANTGDDIIVEKR